MKLTIIITFPTYDCKTEAETYQIPFKLENTKSILILFYIYFIYKFFFTIVKHNTSFRI